MKQVLGGLVVILLVIVVLAGFVFKPQESAPKTDGDYRIFIAKRQSEVVDLSKIPNSYVDSGYAVSRDWYENIWPAYSDSSCSQKLKAIFDEIQISRFEGKVRKFLNLFADGRDLLLFVPVEGIEQSSDEDGAGEKNAIVGSFYVEGDDVDEETLARYVAYAPNSGDMSGTGTEDWVEGNRLWYFNYDVKHIGKEDGGKDIYKINDDNSFVFTKYEIDKVFHVGSFNAYGLTCCQYSSASDTSSVLAIRGTDSVESVLDDAAPEGVGFSGFTLAYPLVESWLEEQKENGREISITGHSLGGSLTQWVAAEWTADGNKLNKVVTFNPAGISKEYADKCATSNIKEVVHHMANGDIVSIAGNAFIKGTAKLYSYPTEAKGFIDYLLQKHTLALTNDNIPLKEKRPDGITVDVVSTDELNSFWNHSSDAQYVNFYSLLDQVVFIRGTTENARKLVGINIGELLGTGDADEENVKLVAPKDVNYVTLLLKILRNSVSLTSNAGWALKDINTDSDKFLPGNIKYENGKFFGGVDLRTPNGFSLPGRLCYSNLGLEQIKVEFSSYSDARELGKAFYLKNADLSLSKIDKVQNLPAVYPQDLPNLDYSLDGKTTVTFGSDSDDAKMGEIKLNAIKTSASANSVSGEIYELNVLFQGKKLLDIEPTGAEFTFVGEDKLSGKANSRFTVYDKVRNGSTRDEWRATSITAPDSLIEFKGGLINDSITITANSDDEQNALAFRYAENEAPALQYGEQKYRYNTESGRWEGESTPLSTNGTPTSTNDETISNIAKLDVVVIERPVIEGSVIERSVIDVSITPSKLTPSSEVYFFLRSTSGDKDDEYVGSVTVSEMNLINGKYVCSFDLAGKGLENGYYSIYAYTDFESKENSVYSDLFDLYFAPPLTISPSYCDFGKSNVGSLAEGNEQIVTISNHSSEKQEFCLGSDTDENFYFTGYYSNGADLNSYDVKLEPDESLTLSIYFIPTTPGVKTETISLLDEDDAKIAEVALSGIAEEMLATEIETSVKGASLSATELHAGDPLTIDCKVINSGENTADATTVTFYVSQSSSKITSGVKLGEETTNWIRGGATESVSLKITSFPELAPGQYYVGWVIESSNDVNSKNNTAVFEEPVEILQTDDDAPAIDVNASSN